MDIADLFRPPFPEDQAAPQAGAEDEGSTEPEDEAPDAGAADDSQEAGDEEDDDGPVSRSKYESDMAGMRSLVNDLRTTVGRAQALARQVEQSNRSDEALAQLREQNVAVAELFGSLVDGIDQTVLDPAMRNRIVQARNDILEAEKRAKMLEELREELGIERPRPGTSTRAQLEALQAEADEVADEISASIRKAGFDPTDQSLFPWKEWAEIMKGEGASAVRQAAILAISNATVAKQSEGRREARRTAAGKSPRGGAAASNRNPLQSGSFEERYKALQGMTR